MGTNSMLQIIGNRNSNKEAEKLIQHLDYTSVQMDTITLSHLICHGR